MHNLIVVGFHNQYRAAEVLNELRRLSDDWVVDLDDAVAVYRDRHGNLRYQQSFALTVGQEAGWGALWGSLLGALLAAPFTAGASAAVGAAPWPRARWSEARWASLAEPWTQRGGRNIVASRTILSKTSAT